MIKKKNYIFKCYRDQFYSQCILRIFLDLSFMQKNKKYGLYNFGGRDRYSRIECLKIFLKLKKN